MRPAPGRSSSASIAPRGSEATDAIEPARGPKPKRWSAVAADVFGSRAIKGSCALQKRRLYALGCEWQFADALAGGMRHGIGDCCSGRTLPTLAGSEIGLTR